MREWGFESTPQVSRLGVEQRSLQEKQFQKSHQDSLKSINVFDFFKWYCLISTINNVKARNGLLTSHIAKLKSCMVI